MLILKRGRQIKSDGVKIPGNNNIKSLQENNGYKYLGVLQNDEVMEKEMKEVITKEYKRRVRKELETKLNRGNIIKAINTWAIPVLKYSAPFLVWRKTELQELDRRTRKLLTMHNARHPKSNVDRIYSPRKEGGRGLLSVEDTINMVTLGLEEYVVLSDERILPAARNIEEVTETQGFKKRMKNERKNSWMEKELHGQYLRQTDEVASVERWLWLRDANLKRETESLILAAQEQAIRTNLIKAKSIRPRPKANAECVERWMKVSIMCLMSVANLRKKSISAGMTGWAKESIGKSANFVDLMSKKSGMIMSLRLSW